jgi:hypothetical protein
MAGSVSRRSAIHYASWVLLVPLVVVRIFFVSLRRPFMDFGKMLNEKLRSCLNFTGTLHVAVPHLFVELCLVVVGLPLLVVHEVFREISFVSHHRPVMDLARC